MSFYHGFVRKRILISETNKNEMALLTKYDQMQIQPTCELGECTLEGDDKMCPLCDDKA
jgi:hypothetical protein